MTQPFFKLAILALGYCAAQASFACTDFSLRAKDGTVMVTRTLEFATQLQSEIVTSPRGQRFRYTAPDGGAGMAWQSRYGYVYLNALHAKIAMDGMNEAGLSFEYLYLPNETQYPLVPRGQDAHALPYYALGSWILGNFKTVAELKQALPKIHVYSQHLASFGQVIFPVHAIIHDAQGQSIVVEFVGGKMQIYDNKIGVTTNAPRYDWQVTNLRNYINLTPISPTQVTVQGIPYLSTGQGSGMLGLPGDASPPSRFVKIAILKATSLPVDQASDLLNLSEHIVNNVDIPKGFVRGKVGNQVEIDYTQWAVFKDLTHQVLYYRSYDNPAVQSISLSKLDFSPSARILSMPIESRPMVIDATAQFLKS